MPAAAGVALTARRRPAAVHHPAAAAAAAAAPRHRRRHCAATAAAVPPSASSPPPPPLLLLIEIDGALVDVLQQGHRVAFNRAFAELGLPPQAAYASAPAFEAALRLGGTGEALVAARLQQTNAWPLPSSDEQGRRGLARRAHEAKQRHFAELVARGELPLRPDVAGVIDAALAAGAAVALLSETASEPEEGLAAAALRALGEERAARVRVLTAGVRRKWRGEEEDEDEAAGGGGANDSDALRLAVARQKAAAAQEFAERFAGAAGSSGGGAAAAIDVSALTAAAAGAPDSAAAAAAQQGVSPTFFSAAVALLGVPAARCACVAATGATVRSAAAAGMVSVAVPRQGAFDASFPEATVKFEAYGPGYLTWPRLAAMVEASSSSSSGAAAAPSPPSSSR